VHRQPAAVAADQLIKVVVDVAVAHAAAVARPSDLRSTRWRGQAGNKVELRCRVCHFVKER
jgi:hypothetical protein